MIHIKPEQLEFLDWEFGLFFHFGIRTFHEGHTDWDGKPMPAEGFQPSALDCEDWVKAARDAGAAYCVFTCKHHDGFANWPSAYTEYSVKNAPWKNGKGDVVREFTDACRKYGLKIGLYYSPAQFGFVKMNAKEYDDYFIAQITELLTNYGRIDYLWFDGCGSEGHNYDTVRIVREIRALQPQILLFNMWDPDTRWIGNESGVADSPNPLVVDAVDFSVQTDKKDRLKTAKFLPAECDCRIRETSWFFTDSDADTVKSLDELMGLYYYSVGRGANLLLNVSPDRRGLLPERDKAALLRFGEEIQKLFADPIPCKTKQNGAVLTLSFDVQPVNHIILAEEITGKDEIMSFTVKAFPHSYGEPITVFRGTTVGHKAICPFPTIRTGRIEIGFDRKKNVDALAFYLPRF